MTLEPLSLPDDLILGDIPSLPADEEDLGLLRFCAADFFRFDNPVTQLQDAAGYFLDRLAGLTDDALDDLVGN
jgi:hypothetical protein